MLCYQCEQTRRAVPTLGCVGPTGTCGKEATTSDLQDILIYQLIGLAQYAVAARARDIVDVDLNDFILHGMFTTLTNVNFAAARFVTLIRDAADRRDAIRARLDGVALDGPAAFTPGETMDALLAQAPALRVDRDQPTVGPDATGLTVLILYGLKGTCAYAHHARVLGCRDPEVDAAILDHLARLATPSADLEDLLARALSVGEVNLKVMDLLDRANTGAFGAQTITEVRVQPRAGKALLVSGHDLHDLKTILEQTRDQGINVYTHGELLPAHAYPKLKGYPHLAGNYGGAWQDQQREFATFPGAIVLTSNCLIEPDRSYRQRLFTTGPTGWPGVRHIADGNYAPAIQAAKALPGFRETEGDQTITVGFGHHTVIGLAETVVAAVKAGAVRRFFVIGGCDGAKPGRNYYTELADRTPADTVILTVGCAKYRFNKQDHGQVGGIPRLLDMGQCNDAHSAIKVAGVLADAFGCGVNDLPLSLMISWFEQKATAVLLSLLAAGVKGIHLGPSLPVYLTPTLLQVLVDRFDLKVNGTPEDDLARALAS